MRSLIVLISSAARSAMTHSRGRSFRRVRGVSGLFTLSGSGARSAVWPRSGSVARWRRGVARSGSRRNH